MSRPDLAVPRHMVLQSCPAPHQRQRTPRSACSLSPSLLRSTRQMLNYDAFVRLIELHCRDSSGSAEAFSSSTGFGGSGGSSSSRPSSWSAAKMSAVGGGNGGSAREEGGMGGGALSKEKAMKVWLLEQPLFSSRDLNRCENGVSYVPTQCVKKKVAELCTSSFTQHASKFVRPLTIARGERSMGAGTGRGRNPVFSEGGRPYCRPSRSQGTYRKTAVVCTPVPCDALVLMLSSLLQFFFFPDAVVSLVCTYRRRRCHPAPAISRLLISSFHRSCRCRSSCGCNIFFYQSIPAGARGKGSEGRAGVEGGAGVYITRAGFTSFFDSGGSVDFTCGHRCFRSALSFTLSGLFSLLRESLS